MPRIFLSCLVAVLGFAACNDASNDASRVPTAPDIVEPANLHRAARAVTAAALWNQRTRAIIGRQKVSSNGAARLYAIVSVAQYDAVIAAGTAGRSAHGRHPSEAGAASAAAATVLATLYPPELTFIQQQLADDAVYFQRLPSERRTDFAAGAALGQAVGTATVAYAATDGSDVGWDGTVVTGVGHWTPLSLPPQDAAWGSIRPWLMTTGNQFHSPTPPSMGSPVFLADLAEVRYISEHRTAEQEKVARFWASGYGAGGPAGYFGNVGATLAGMQRMDERRTARMLAVLHMAIMDASIGCYESKYTYWSIRPYQADPVITIPTGVSNPNFPSYPSAHSCLSAAAAGVLSGFFPAAADDLRKMVDEAGVSRIYAGLHFRFEITAGQKLGSAVADLALRHAPRGHQPIPLE